MFVNRRDRAPCPGCPMQKMLDGANVPASRYLCIASVTHLFSKPF
jgi:hypothetical protein